MKVRGKARPKIKSSHLPAAEESCLELRGLGESSISLSMDQSKAREIFDGASSNENENPNIWSEQGPLTADRTEQKELDYDSVPEASVQLSKRSKSPARNDYLRIISRGSSMTSDGMKESAYVKENQIKLEIGQGVMGREKTRKIIGNTIEAQRKNNEGKLLGVTQVMGIFQRNGLIGGTIESNFAHSNQVMDLGDFQGLNPLLQITSKANRLYSHSYSIPFSRKIQRKQKSYKFIIPYSECAPLYILNTEEAQAEFDQLLLQNLKHSVKTANKIMRPLKG